MAISRKWCEALDSDNTRGVFGRMSVCSRYGVSKCERTLEGFCSSFGRDAEFLFSAPGRTEIGGNHTDHENGCVLAGSVNLDITAAVAKNSDNVIRVLSEGYKIDIVKLDELDIRECETNKSVSLVRGIAARFRELGHDISGFDAYTTSNVLKGSGLSSSAAFEVLVGTIINNLFCNSSRDFISVAQIGQYAENVYFGKPCGLLDQMASAAGGAVFMDFRTPENPIVERIEVDCAKYGYELCIIDSGAGHADLTHEYAAVTKELDEVCGFFGKQVLREVPYNDFMREIAQVRALVGDRACLRALHIYAENERASLQKDALERGDFDEFLKLITESGRSSYMYLQKLIPGGASRAQDVALTLALCVQFLHGRGACRVHGGGFAGTVQAFVPCDMSQDFKSSIERVLGDGSCYILQIRAVGGVLIAGV
ncbi:MAG: galactokinase family protein [Oscillospiraceae bacterium]